MISEVFFIERQGQDAPVPVFSAYTPSRGWHQKKRISHGVFYRMDIFCSNRFCIGRKTFSGHFFGHEAIIFYNRPFCQDPQVNILKKEYFF